MSHSGRDGLLMSIFRSTLSDSTRAGDMCIIIRPQFAALKEKLERTFAGHEDVGIIVDRRSGERRKNKELFLLERRMAERRKARVDMVEVVISF